MEYKRCSFLNAAAHFTSRVTTVDLRFRGLFDFRLTDPFPGGHIWK